MQAAIAPRIPRSQLLMTDRTVLLSPLLFSLLLQCVPVKMRLSLNPIIAKLKTEKMIQLDPLTQPELMRSIGEIPVPQMSEEIEVTEPSQEELEKAMMFGDLTDEDIQQLQMTQGISPDQSFDTEAVMQRGRWGGGWGRGW